MNRRNFLQVSAAAAAGVHMIGRMGVAQTPADNSTRKKLKIDAYSRHLQWLRSADEVADAAIEMGFDGVDITVRPYPGHVEPEKVKTDLPPFVNAVRKRGLQVVTITCPITDADSPHAEEILRTASSLGITHYWWGTFRYEPGKPVMQQLDALKPRVAKLAALNAKYKMKAMYHTYSGNFMVGAAIWDFLHVLQDFDPAQVGFHYDIGHMTNAGGNGTWVLNLRAAGPYIAGLSVKDSLMEPVSVQPGAAGRGAGRGGGRGGSTTPDPWRVRQVPLGEGMDNLPELAQILKEINFSGPAEIQAEYPNGGAENAQDKITLPRADVLGAMKRDLQVLRAAFGPAGLL